MNFSNNAFGAAAPLVTGYLLGSGSSYAAAFGVAGGLLLIGIAAFGWLMGRIEPMPSPPG
jgi:dipeptide/tripeptide permease